MYSTVSRNSSGFTWIGVYLDDFSFSYLYSDRSMWSSLVKYYRSSKFCEYTSTISPRWFRNLYFEIKPVFYSHIIDSSSLNNMLSRLSINNRVVSEHNDIRTLTVRVKPYRCYWSAEEMQRRLYMVYWKTLFAHKVYDFNTYVSVTVLPVFFLTLQTTLVDAESNYVRTHINYFCIKWVL